MSKKDFAEILNDMEGLTIGQIFRLIAKLKYSTAAILISFVFAFFGTAFAIGKYMQEKETAVMLESPFSMRIEIAEKKYDFSNLTLTKDPSMPPPEEGKVILSLREIQSAFDIIPVGLVVAKVDPNKAKSVWQVIISQADVSNKAYADTPINFDWRGHENDYNFTERFIDPSTIQRTYSDGCILEYDVDKGRRSVHSSFRWVKTTH